MKALIKFEFNNLKNQPEGTSMTEGLNFPRLVVTRYFTGVSRFRGVSVDGDFSPLRRDTDSWDGTVIGKALFD